MKKYLFAYLLMIASIVCITAQTPDKTPDKSYIDVTGSAELDVVPDEIYLFIRLLERKQSRTVLQQEVEMKNRLKNIGISLENLSVKNFTGDYRQYKLFKKDMQATKEFILKLSTAKQLDTVFQQLDILDVEDVGIERLSHSKMPEFRKEVKIKAIKAAKEKADYLLEAIGEQTGKPIYIIENQEDMDIQMQTQKRSNYKYSNVSSNNMEVKEIDSSEFQKLRIRFTMTARFSIK
jgi:uncharacterized protein